MCKRCGIQVPEGRLNTRHYVLDKRKKGEERHIRRETLQLCFEASRVLFHINAETVLPPEVFPYLRRTIAYNNIDWGVVYLNLRKARRWWGMVARLLERTGAMVRAQGDLYKVVMQSVMLCGSENWVVIGDILRVLAGLHHWLAWRITGMTEKREAGGEWDYPLVVEEMEATGIHPIGVYIKRR